MKYTIRYNNFVVKQQPHFDLVVNITSFQFPVISIHPVPVKSIK